jgi:hypothetical protein
MAPNFKEIKDILMIDRTKFGAEGVEVFAFWPRNKLN